VEMQVSSLHEGREDSFMMQPCLWL